MPLSWKLFRLVCLLQMMICLVLCGYSGTRALAGGFSFYFVLDTAVYLAMIFLANLGIHIVNNNYPDIPITDKLKRRFNQLFLVNFILIAVLFGHLFREIQAISQLRELFRNYEEPVPVSTYFMVVVYIVVLLFQFIVLFGLYQLRRDIYLNFVHKKFEFEEHP